MAMTASEVRSERWAPPPPERARGLGERILELERENAELRRSHDELAERIERLESSARIAGAALVTGGREPTV